MVFFVLFFPENRLWHFMQVCMKCHSLSSEKKYVKMSSGEIFSCMQNIKNVTVVKIIMLNKVYISEISSHTENHNLT